MSAERLYTAQVLGLATQLAAWPWDEGLPLRGASRSRSCGSSLELALELDGQGRIARIGLRAQACAIGQAAAAIFAGGAQGLDGGAVRGAAEELATWLAGAGAMPDWPGLDALAAAQAVPGRHGAIMLAWNAARDLLPSGPDSR